MLSRSVRSSAGPCIIEALETRALLSSPVSGEVEVFKPHTHGVSQLSANWWKWDLAFSASTPPAAPTDPVNDTTGALAGLNQSGKTFFLAGGAPGTARSFNVPAGKNVLVPLLVTELSTLEGAGSTPKEVRANVKALADLIDNLHATIDGHVIPSAELFAHREVSPIFHFVAAPNNTSGDPAGFSGVASADGYWLLLAPLPAGTHTINFGGGISSYGYSVDVTDTITVTGGEHENGHESENRTAFPSAAASQGVSEHGDDEVLGNGKKDGVLD